MVTPGYPMTNMGVPPPIPYDPVFHAPGIPAAGPIANLGTIPYYNNKTGERITKLPEEAKDPIYDYLDPISVSLQERLNKGNRGHGGYITAVIEKTFDKPAQYLFKLRQIGEENLARNPAACIAAEIEKHENRFLKAKVYYRISDHNNKTGKWGCGRKIIKVARPNTSTAHNEHNCTLHNCKMHSKKTVSYKIAS